MFSYQERRRFDDIARHLEQDDPDLAVRMRHIVARHRRRRWLLAPWLIRRYCGHHARRQTSQER